MDHPTQTSSRLAHSKILSQNFFIRIVVFVCTILWSSGDSFSFVKTSLQQWSHKQHQYHSTCLLVLTHIQMKYCTAILGRLWRNVLHSIEPEHKSLSNNTRSRLKPGLDGARLVEWRDVTCSANRSEQKRQSGYTTRRSSANGGPAALLG